MKLLFKIQDGYFKEDKMDNIYNIYNEENKIDLEELAKIVDNYSLEWYIVMNYHTYCAFIQKAQKNTKEYYIKLSDENLIIEYCWNKNIIIDNRLSTGEVRFM